MTVHNRCYTHHCHNHTFCQRHWHNIITVILSSSHTSLSYHCNNHTRSLCHVKFTTISKVTLSYIIITTIWEHCHTSFTINTTNTKVSLAKIVVINFSNCMRATRHNCWHMRAIGHHCWHMQATRHHCWHMRVTRTTIENTSPTVMRASVIERDATKYNREPS